MGIANTPEPPYFVVIFTTFRTEGDNGYMDMSEHMLELAGKQDGFLGIESVRGEMGITVSYWKDLESIKAWKNHAEHVMARDKGRAVWYRRYKARIAEVTRDYEWTKPEV